MLAHSQRKYMSTKLVQGKNCLASNEFPKGIGFSPDQTRLATLTYFGASSLWKTPTGEPVAHPLPHGPPVSGVLFSPDGALLLTFSSDGTARLWHAADGRPMFGPLNHSDAIKHAFFDPQGRWVITVAGMTLHQWDTRTGRRIGTPWVHPNPIDEAHLSADGRRLLVLTSRGGWFWDTAAGRLVNGPFGASSANFIKCVLQHDAARAVLADVLGGVQVWDPERGERLGEPLQFGDEVLGILATRDGSHLIGFTRAAQILVWYVPEAQLPIPSWFADLAEAFAGAGLGPEGRLETVPFTRRWTVCRSVATLRPEGFYGRWAAWFSAPGSRRPVLPTVDRTVHQEADRLAQFNTFPTLLHAAHLCPTNNRILLGLAVRLREEAPARSAPHLARLADWLTARQSSR